MRVSRSRGVDGGDARIQPRTGRGRRSALVGWLAALSAASLLMVPGPTWADEVPQPTEPAATSAGTGDLDVLAGDPADATPAETDTPPMDAGSATPVDPTTVSPGSTETGSTGKPAPTENAGATDPKVTDSDATIQDDDASIVPLAVGTPDGGTAPYVYWTVKDQNGDLVPGATFKFEYRINRGTAQRPNWSWSTGTNADVLSDCSGTCSTNASGDTLDRDSDGGEYLLEHFGTSRGTGTKLVSTNNYRVTPVSAPAGYTWVDSSARSINGSNNTAPWNNGNGTDTHNFGTFLVQKINYVPSCEAGYVYGISSGGQIQQVAPGALNSNVTTLGSTPSTKSDFNGLGIGYGGSPVYAYARGGTGNSTSDVEIFKYDTATGTWASTGVNVNSAANGGTAITFVAGGVNLDNGRFYLGGYTTSGGSGRVFRLWEYDPAANAVTYKGSIATPTNINDQANGDLAFNANGDLFVIRGTLSTTTVYSVTAANLADANGGTIVASPSKTVDNTSSNVNGVAFDSDGQAYLGSSSNVDKYKMPDWSDKADFTTSLSSSTDLAGCGSPPTIVIEKEVIGGRVNSGDQFSLTLSKGSTLLGEATTSGTAIGLQNDRIGPLPTVRNVALNFAEVGANGASLANYASAYQCTVTYRNGTVVNLDQVNGTSGSVTIPADGDAVRCVFRNSPLIANVTIHKDVVDVAGVTTAGQGWTVGATASATSGTVTKDPNDNTLTTNASGDATWKLTFGSYAARATVNVSEVMQTGYEFGSGQCVVTSLTGAQSTTPLTGPASTAVTGVAPGDQVNCTYTNRQKPGSVTWNKVDDQTPAAPLGGSEWTITGPGAPAPGIVVTDCAVSAPATCPTGAFKDQDPAAGTFRLDGLAWGSYTVTETKVPAGHTGTNTFTFTVDSSSAGTAIAKGSFVNKRTMGTVTWTKIDGQDNFLAGSVWMITPTNPAGSAVEVEDNTGQSGYAGPDTNPAAGEFRVEGLAWGDYTLSEVTPPPGYVLGNISQNFTISATNLNQVFVDGFVNIQQDGPVLPLTGGIGRDHVYIAGALVLLLAAAAYGTRRFQGRNNPRSA